MLMDAVITLRDTTTTSSSTAASTKSNTDKTVFAELRSVGYAEHFAAQAVGASVDLVFIVNEDEYSGQMTVVYESATYKVTRTYLKYGRVELHCTRR